MKALTNAFKSYWESNFKSKYKKYLIALGGVWGNQQRGPQWKQWELLLLHSLQSSYHWLTYPLLEPVPWRKDTVPLPRSWGPLSPKFLYRLILPIFIYFLFFWIVDRENSRPITSWHVTWTLLVLRRSGSRRWFPSPKQISGFHMDKHWKLKEVWDHRYL